MLTLTANKILRGTPKADYWDSEQWRAGDYQAVMIK